MRRLKNNGYKNHRTVGRDKKAIDKAATTGDKYQFIDPVFDLTDELEQCETPLML